MKPKRNVGRLDAVLRIVVGFVVALWVTMGSHGPVTTTVGTLTAATLILSATFAYCPLYALLGWSTSRRDRFARRPPDW